MSFFTFLWGDIMKIGVCIGSYDPPTIAHLDIIHRSFQLFDKIVVGIGINTNKKPLFTPGEREQLIRESMKDDRIEVKTFNCLAVDFARQEGACAIIRGIRNSTDYEWEHQLTYINARICPEIGHIYLMANEKDHFISSSVVKELWAYGQQYKLMVPDVVFNAMEKRREQRNHSGGVVLC
jgi:pantetheine-phosphate adenylyltransferase